MIRFDALDVQHRRIVTGVQDVSTRVIHSAWEQFGDSDGTYQQPPLYKESIFLALESPFEGWDGFADGTRCKDLYVSTCKRLVSCFKT